MLSAHLCLCVFITCTQSYSHLSLNTNWFQTSPPSPPTTRMSHLSNIVLAIALFTSYNEHLQGLHTVCISFFIIQMRNIHVIFNICTAECVVLSHTFIQVLVQILFYLWNECMLAFSYKISIYMQAYICSKSYLKTTLKTTANLQWLK